MDSADDFNELEKAIKEASSSNKWTVLVCPQCGSKNIMYYMGMKTGVQYQCKNCDYVGAFIIGKDRE